MNISGKLIECFFLAWLGLQMVSGITICNAQSKISFMGLQNQSEYLEGFLIESDSTAIAMVNLRAPFADSKVAIIRMDTAMNLLKCTRYFKPNVSLNGFGFTNHSNGRSVVTILEIDILSSKLFYSQFLLNEQLNTISCSRIKHFDKDNNFGWTSLMLHNDKIYGVLNTPDSLSNEHFYLVKIDLINKVVLTQVELLPPQNRLLYLSDFSIDSLQNLISIGIGIETDSASNFFNPCFITMDTTFTIVNNLYSTDTIDPSDGIANIQHLDSKNYLIGYNRKSINPFTTKKYYLAKLNLYSGIVFEKIFSPSFDRFNFAFNYDTIQHQILLISGRNTILLDSLGNVISTIGHLTNPAYPFSNFGISGFHIWNQKPLITGSFNFGTSLFDAGFIWPDSNLISCDHSIYTLAAADTINNFTSFPLQLVPVDSLIEFIPDTFFTDSTTLPLYNYCYTTAVAETNSILPLQVYPNPTNGKFHFTNEENRNRLPVSCKIYDLSGRFVKSIDFIGYDADYSIQECDAGMYILILNTTEGYKYSTKILKN
ncbi:MAG: T9SS type A sorting domain-containing protein [Bacteroidia bacterium]